MDTLDIEKRLETDPLLAALAEQNVRMSDEIYRLRRKIQQLTQDNEPAKV